MDKKLFRAILWIITYAVALVFLIVRFDAVRAFVGSLLSLLRPLAAGFAIAFVLKRPCGFFQRLYEKPLGRRGKALAPALAIATVYLLLAALVVAFFALVLPKLIESIALFMAGLNGYVSNLQGSVNALLSVLHIEALDLSSFSSLIRGALNSLMTALTTALPQLISITSGIISVVITAFLSVIFSVYMLSGQKVLLSQCRRLVKAYVPHRAAGWLLDVVHLTADTFTAFISGQLIEACILGGATTLGMLFIQADYAPLVGMIVGCTALVPMIGSYVGGILSAALLVMVSPWKALVFLLFLVCLQQFEGNVIYPRVVGSSIGLPPIWVLAAVTVGSGLLGFVGILISVPIASVAYTLLRRNVHRRLDAPAP